MPSRAKRKKASQHTATGRAAARSGRPARGGPGAQARGAGPAEPDAAPGAPASDGPGATTSEHKLPPGLTRRRGPAQAPAGDHGLAPGRPASWAPAGPRAADGFAPDVRPRSGTVARQAPAGPGQPGPASDGSPDDMPSWAVKTLEEVLTCTCWLDPGEHGEPFSATIRFSGRRTPRAGQPSPADAFRQDETVSGIVPGSGPVATTAEVRGLHPGDWAVTARPSGRVSYRALPGRDDGGGRQAPWPRRVAVRDTAAATVHTARAPFAKVPGIVRFAYAGLITLGVLAGLGVEALLLKHDHYPVRGPLLYSVAAVAAGVVGAKVWYIAEQRGRKLDGWCIQAFITGAAVVVVATALAGVGVPPGPTWAQRPRRCCWAWRSAGPAASGQAAAPGGPPRRAGASGHRTAGSVADAIRRNCSRPWPRWSSAWGCSPSCCSRGWRDRAPSPSRGWLPTPWAGNSSFPCEPSRRDGGSTAAR
jgi:hypothetical protein